MDEHAKQRTEAGIARIHSHLTRLLRELDATAAATGLSYYLAYGSAIGALRHRDFIPWDIDADVLIWRHEYEQMISALRERLPEDMTLHTPEDGSDYEYLFARIGLRGFDHPDAHVDLFPLEPAPATRFQQRLYSAGARFLYQMYFVKNMRVGSRTHYTGRKRIVARLGKLILRPVPSRYLYRMFMAFTGWFAARSDGEFVSNSCGSYGMREFFRRSWFDSAEPTPFRDAELRVPSGSKEMLEWIYGDYMTPPPQHLQDRQIDFIENHLVGRLRSQGVI